MQITPDVLFGVASGILGSALYGLSVVVYRSQSDGIRPLAISSYKMWVALPFMALLILIPTVPSPFSVPLEVVLLLAISILAGAVIGDTVYLISQERIGVSYAFPIAMSFPILTYVFTIIFLGEVLLLSRMLGAVIAVCGVVLISREQEKGAKEIDLDKKLDVVGILLAVVTAILYAMGTTVLQVGVTDIDAITGNFIRVFFGSVSFAPMFAIAWKKGMPLPTKKATKYVVLAAFFGMAVGSLLYVTAVKYAGAAITSVIASSAPLFAVPASVFYLNEKLTKLAGLGVIATILGVVLVVLGV